MSEHKTIEVIRDGNHALRNLSDEEKMHLPTHIPGICACGASGLYVKMAPFSNSIAWYLCSGCHWMIDCWWLHEERKFKMIRELLFLVGQQAPISDEMAAYARKLLGEHSEEADTP